MDCIKKLKIRSLAAINLHNDMFVKRCNDAFFERFEYSVKFISHEVNDIATVDIEGLTIMAYELNNKICFEESGYKINSLYDLGRAFKRLEKK